MLMIENFEPIHSQLITPASTCESVSFIKDIV